MLLAHQVAVVTGATSGIGAATAVAFAEAGAKLVVSGRSEAGARATVDRVENVGGEARVLLGDVTDPTFADELIAFAVTEFGRLDVLANVAGTITRGDATETTDDEWYTNMRVNADSVFFMSRAAIKQFRTQRSDPLTNESRGSGSDPRGNKTLPRGFDPMGNKSLPRGSDPMGVIVNLASNVGLVGSAGLPAYCASKGAVVLLTKAMALDHASEGIRINALCPGAVDTPMLVSAHEKTGRTPDDVFGANIAGIPEGRIPEPAEIAKSMLYLASDQSSHVTGVALPIDGGYVAG